MAFKLTFLQTFEHDLFAGERIIIFPDKPKQKQQGIVRDKAIFSATHDRPKMVRVFVRLPNDSQNETVVDEKSVARPPRTFTKITLRSFLRHCIQKGSQNGAPWVVKEEIARQYNIPTQLPLHLRPETIRAEKKARENAQKGRGRTRELPIIMNGNSNSKSAASLTAKASSKPHAQCGQFSELQFTQPPPPPIKYPIEDLELPPKKDPTPRPALKSFRQADLFPTDDARNDDNEFESFSVGPLLETWNTLNVFAQFFAIDNFTLDDFAGAMFLASEKVPCELFTEVHCAVLKKLVSVEKEIWAQSLTVVDDDESDDEAMSVSDGSDQSEPQKTLRSSQRNQAQSPANKQVNGVAKDSKSHRAEDMLEDDEWVERLAERDFTNGGWQLIMVGVLDQLSHKVAFKTECERILKHLAPVDREASMATACSEYMKLDVNLRIAALQIIVMLAIETRPFKDHMEECLQEATSIRKERTSFQQQKKQL